MPTIDRELELTQASLKELGILPDVQQLTSRHFSVPAGGEDTLHAMLLGPGTPAHSPTDLALGLDWGKNHMGQPFVASHQRPGCVYCDGACDGSSVRS